MPEVLAWDETAGLMILTDLGRTDVSQHLRSHPNKEREVYETAVDILQQLHRIPVLDALPRVTPAVGAAILDPAFGFAARDHSADLRLDISELTMC